MRFFQILASSAAFIAAALALEINEYPSTGVEAGKTYQVTYSPADNTPTTFVLRKGVSTDLGTVGTLTTSATGGTFSWTVATDLADGSDYALEIKRGDTINYSAQFGLTGGSAAASSASASASASSASAYSVSSVIASKASSASSAASASASSLISSLISSAASATGTGAVTASQNGTISSATLSRSATASRATGSATGSASIPESTGAASSLSSAPLALLFGAAGAFAFLN